MWTITFGGNLCIKVGLLELLISGDGPHPFVDIEAVSCSHLLLVNDVVVPFPEQYANNWQQTGNLHLVELNWI